MLKLYEVKRYKEPHYWYTQRTECGNCYEIQTDAFERTYRLVMNEDTVIGSFDDFKKAEHALRELEKNDARYESLKEFDEALPKLRELAAKFA